MKLNVCQSDLAYLAPDDLVKVLQEIKAFGFTKVRWEVPFHAVYPLPGKKNWASVIHVLDMLKAVGLEHLPVLGAHLPPFNKVTPADYAQFCVTAIDLMKKHCDASEVELWNEPNLVIFWPRADPKTFFPFIERAYGAIKAKYGNEVLILHGGLAAADTPNWMWRLVFGGFKGWNKKPIEFLQAELELAKGKPFFDKVAYHPYSLDAGFNKVEPSAKVFGIEQITVLEKVVGKLVYTEMGFSGLGDSNQMYSLSTYYELVDMEDAYFYCWRDTGGETYGLVNTRNQSKNPYYDFVHGLIR